MEKIFIAAFKWNIKKKPLFANLGISQQICTLILDNIMAYFYYLLFTFLIKVL